MTISPSNHRLAALAACLALAAAALAAWGASASAAIGNPEIRPAEMVGGGWLAAGPHVKAHIQVGLPCPGEEVGFNPQPDPPGHLRARLTLSVGGERYQLDEVTGVACTVGDAENRDGGTHQGSGLASCGGERGFVVDWRLTDAGIGNPNDASLGGPDTVEIDIRGPGEAASCSNNLHLAGPLGGGNLRMVPAVQREGGGR